MNNQFYIPWESSPSVINIELTSQCNKKCFMCGRRKLENKHPELCNWGDMDLELALNIVWQIPKGIIIQFHSNGEPLLYPHLEPILSWSYKCIRCFDTNGILLIEKANEIINNMESLTISVIQDDPLGDEQYEIVKKFLEIKGDRKPYVIFRLLGDVGYLSIDNINKLGGTQKLSQLSNYVNNYFIKDNPTLQHSIDQLYKERKERWYTLAKIYNCLIATRILHSPLGSFDYQKKVTIPETGICQDLLHHLAIDRYGKVSICVRFDIYNELVIGDVNKESLLDIWNGKKRRKILEKHIQGKRKELPYCGKKCHYWGIPRGE